MTLSQLLLPEFDHEMNLTRRTLERVPEDRPDFRPHPKSMPLGRLAGHVAELPAWVAATLALESLDLAAGGDSLVMRSRAQVLEAFDRGVREGRAALEKATDEQMQVPWSLFAGERRIFTMPRLVVLRGFVMNHLVHHRGQLTVYLRLNDAPVPSLYGPSADEPAM